MKVGLVVPGFSAHASDWCIPALRHLARSLAVRDEVRVITVRYPYRSDRYTVDGADVLAIGGATSRGLATLHVWRRTLSVLQDEHRRRPFDVLHAFWATESGLLAAMAGRLLRIPTLVSLAGGELVALPEIGYGDQRIAWERLKVRASLRLASAVSAGSLQLLRVAERRLATSNTFRKPHHAPLGVDLQLFSPTPAGAQATKRLFHVGSLTAVKDQVTLLHAFARLHRQDSAVSLEISGDGPLRQKLERVVGELGIAAAVSFSGEIDHAGLPAVYRAGTVFVVSSRHEAQCMVAIEAAACGLPIVGTCVGVIPELAGASGDAVLVGSPETLAVALSNALDDPTSRASFALDRARQHFSLEGCTNRFRALYAGLAD